MDAARRDCVTHHELWAGIDFKLQSARFHLDRMGKALEPPETTAYTVALESTGALIGGNWHQAFYAHLDAFLSAARSVPGLIRCCFGVEYYPKQVRDWFDKKLDDDEQQRRREFKEKFRSDHEAFNALPLAKARIISEHRTGVPPIAVTVTGLFGITYIGGPTKPIPTSEMRDMPPELGWMQKPVAVRPMWSDFEIDGKPLFETCNDYLDRAGGLVGRAREMAEEIHGTRKLTSPPREM